MTAPSPREKLRAAAAELAAILGWPIPDEIDLKYRDHAPLSVSMAEPARPKRKIAEVRISQVIQDHGPRTPKELMADTKLPRSTVYAAITALIDRGEVEEKDGKVSLL